MNQERLLITNFTPDIVVPYAKTINKVNLETGVTKNKHPIKIIVTGIKNFGYQETNRN